MRDAGESPAGGGGRGEDARPGAQGGVGRRQRTAHLRAEDR